MGTLGARACRVRARWDAIGAWSIVLVEILVGVGCGCSASHGRADGGEPEHDAGRMDAGDHDGGPDVGRFLQAYARALCAGFPHCDFEPLWESVELCTREHPLLSEIASPHLRYVPWGADRLVESGVVAFDSDAAMRCLEDLRGRCPGHPVLSPLTEQPASCQRVFMTRLARAEGERCTYTFECADDAYCSNVDLTCGWEQRCMPRRPPGAECEHDSQCAQPRAGRADCVREPPDSAVRSRCREVVPGPNADEGEACGWLGAPSDTLLRTPCGPALSCLPSLEAPSMGVCTQLPGDGDSCLPDPHSHLCARHGYCDRLAGNCVLPSIITEDMVLDGTECPSGLAPFGFCSVSEGLACIVGEGCVRWGEGVEGSRCAALASCEAGLFCRGSYCVPAKPSGETCARNRQCVSGCCQGSECVEVP